jgi:predicted GNAT superfamily acetyltransferase
MSIVIRDVREHELDSVLALNNAAGVTILQLDQSRLRFFYDHAAYFRVAEVDGTLAGFLIALDQDSPYESSNYLWFRSHTPRSSISTAW